MVMNPKLYQQQIDEVGIEGFKLEPSSLAGAMNLLIELKKGQRILQQIKYNLRMDMRSIRKEYLKKLDSLQESSKMMGLFDKKLTDKEARKAKKILLMERDELISPYEGLEVLVDHYLIQIEDSKTFLAEYIQKSVE